MVSFFGWGPKGEAFSRTISRSERLRRLSEAAG